MGRHGERTTEGGRNAAGQMKTNESKFKTDAKNLLQQKEITI